jgi:hypothetical protein
VARPDGDNPETLVAAGFTPPRPVVRPGEEVLHRLIEIAQRLLLHHLAAVSQPLVLRAGIGQLTTLNQITRCTTAPGTPPRLLLDGQVPNEPGMGAVSGEDSLLRGERSQAVAGHKSKLLTDTDILEEVKRLCPNQENA